MELEIYGDKTTYFSAHGGYEAGVDPALKPCPFCGGTDIEVGNTHTPYYSATCSACGAEGPLMGSPVTYRSDAIKSAAKVERMHREAFTEAVAAWNMRKA